MGDHMVLCVDRLITHESFQSLQETEVPKTSVDVAHCQSSVPPTFAIDVESTENFGASEEPLIQTIECRICQEEDSIKNLENPCACRGSLKYAHRKCVQQWCNEKRDIVCEICCQHFQPGYVAPPPAPNLEDVTFDFSEWERPETPFDLHNRRLMAMATAERHFLESEYDEYDDSAANGSSFCRSTALILMGLLLLRHALYLTDGDEEDDISTFFSLFLLRVVGFLLPCYIMAWAISMLQRRRQRQSLLNQEAAALTDTEVALMLQASQGPDLLFTIAPAAAEAPAGASRLEPPHPREE